MRIIRPCIAVVCIAAAAIASCKQQSVKESDSALQSTPDAKITATVYNSG